MEAGRDQIVKLLPLEDLEGLPERNSYWEHPEVEQIKITYPEQDRCVREPSGQASSYCYRRHIQTLTAQIDGEPAKFWRDKKESATEVVVDLRLNAKGCPSSITSCGSLMNPDISYHHTSWAKRGCQSCSDESHCGSRRHPNGEADSVLDCHEASCAIYDQGPRRSSVINNWGLMWIYWMSVKPHKCHRLRPPILLFRPV